MSLVWPDNTLFSEITDVTADFLYIRWEGDRKTINGKMGKIEQDRTFDLTVWAQKIKPFLKKGMDGFGYFGKYFSGYPPSDVKIIQSELSKK